MAEVLIIHDHDHLRGSLLDLVRVSGHTCAVAHSLPEARGRHTGHYAVVLAGVRKGVRVATMVDGVRAEWPSAEVLVIGDSRELGAATEAVRCGAYDYLPEPVDPDKLIEALHRASRSARRIHDDGGRSAPTELEDLEPCDPLTRAVVEKADRAAGFNSTILITGESGTGKEVLARRIYRRSVRSRFNFVAVNCGALPETLVESELFGHRKGAFTGAISDSKGLIEEAERGVLFLDEIGDMSPSLQVRLLRFLDSHEVRPVGATVVKHVDVRVIAATHRSLPIEIRNGRFRQDLYYRLNVLSIHLPPLRERRQDITPLVHFHVQRAARALSTTTPLIADDALSVLNDYPWPGNVRELQNTIEQAVVQQSNGVITTAELPASVRDRQHRSTVAHAVDYEPDDDALLDTLHRHHGNHTAAAAALGISRTTLWRRLKRIKDAPKLHASSPESLLAV